MALPEIAVMLGFALVYILLIPGRWRGWALLLASVIGVYALFPPLNIRWLEYSLATATLLLAVGGWWLTRAPGRAIQREDVAVFASVVLIALGMTAARQIDLSALISRPPPLLAALTGIALAVGSFGLVVWPLRKRPARLTVGLLALIALFIVLKTDALTTALASLLRAQVGQDASLASPLDVRWLGFSYVAFRLIHTLRDRQTGLLPALSLRQYLTYVVFFPAYAAGPIDRAEHHQKADEALATLNARDPQRITIALTRIGIGLFKKFVIADGLAIFSLSAVTAAQVETTAGLWLLLYAYAFRLYFDFSGYTDIAIGIGLLFGVRLPENFDRPYLRPNIAAFWQSWHKSLSDWARFYVYTPLTRSLLRRKWGGPLVFGLASLATMLMIGLWHGVTVPFFVWGVWHGLGLTIHKLWSDRTRRWYRDLQKRPGQRQLWQVGGVLLTFHFVLLGWVWFAAPDLTSALRVFGGLVGVRW